MGVRDAPVRLTRRGRLVVLVFLLAVAALSVAAAARASGAAGPPGAAPTVVVEPGDPLWPVSERHLPDGGQWPRLPDEVRDTTGVDLRPGGRRHTVNPNI